MNFVIPFCFVFIIAVFANQVTVPVIQYPAYQQSVCNSPTVPIVYQATAASYSHPCAQYTTAQNQAPNHIANTLVSKVLSNPTIHRILDPNSRLYNQNGMELHKTMYNRATVPNIINNYFIVPPEFLKFNESELDSITSSPNILNNGVNHKPSSDENVEILAYPPQSTFASKENIVQSNHDISQCIQPNQLSIPCRKVRRKKARKRIKSKFLTPQSIIKENAPAINSGYQQKYTSDLENTIPEDEITNTRNQKNANNELEVKETSIQITNQVSVPSDNDVGQKKKTKKRKKSKPANPIQTNSPNAPNTEVACNIDKENQEVIAEKECVQEPATGKGISKESVIQDTSRNYEQTLQSSSRNELNEECFDDLVSLISCISNSDSRVIRNSQNDELLRDFRQKFPDVPENLARNMLSFVQNQYKNKYQSQYQNPINSLFYYPGLPFSYDQMYQMPYLYNSNIDENKLKSKRRRRKHKNRKVRNKKQNKTSNKTVPKLSDLKLLDSDTENSIESTTVKVEDLITDIIYTTGTPILQMEDVDSYTPTFTTLLPTVTEMYLLKSEETPGDYDSNKNRESEEETQRNYEETEDQRSYHENEMPELGEEDTVPIIYTNRLIDDYYPTFIDNSYYANDNGYTITDLNDRYYYTTDRNVENISRERRKFESFKETVPKKLTQSFRDTIPKHSYFDAERESYKNLIKDIQPKSQFKYQVNPTLQKEIFRTPPALENPDFMTKRINKDSINLEHYRTEDSFDDVAVYFDYGDDPFIHSTAKSLFYNSKSLPHSEMDFVPEIPIKSSGGEVETVFASSKVAKYGVESDNSNHEFTTIKDFKDDEICVVTAQSLEYPEEVW